MPRVDSRRRLSLLLAVGTLAIRQVTWKQWGLSFTNFLAFSTLAVVAVRRDGLWLFAARQKLLFASFRVLN
jgi:hypothetical protein